MPNHTVPQTREGLKPLARILVRLEELGCRPRGRNGTWAARCPVHDDGTAFLRVSAAHDGQVRLRCGAGCATEAVLERMGLSWRALFPDVHCARNDLFAEAATEVVPNSFLLDAGQLLEQPVEEEEGCVWERIVERGGLTLLVGREKSGKSTLVYGLLRDLLRRNRFLGLATSLQGRVALLTEEHPRQVRKRLQELGLSPDELRDRVLVAFRYDPAVRTRSLADVLRECALRGCELAIVDTWAAWAGLVGENAENDAARVQEAINPVREVAIASNMAVLIVHHANKLDGSPRGSTALSAAVDNVVTLTLPRGADLRSRQRRLQVVGRYESPWEATIELGPDGYRVVRGGPPSRDEPAPPAREPSQAPDHVERFLAAATVRDPRGRERASAVWRRYVDWCRGVGIEPLGRTAFGRRLTRLGFRGVKQGGLIWRSGLRLRSDGRPGRSGRS